MSEGSPRVIFRIPRKLALEMEAQIVKSHTTRREAPWTTTDFVIIAIKEKLAKMKRCARPRGRTPRPRPVEPLDLDAEGAAQELVEVADIWKAVEGYEPFNGVEEPSILDAE
jgi:hypothetical protein